MKQGLEHKGFSFIDVFSPCVTFNHDNTYAWFRERVKKLEDDPSYDSSDLLGPNAVFALSLQALWLVRFESHTSRHQSATNDG